MIDYQPRPWPTQGVAPDVPHVPISVGELIDKITILEIKLERIADARRRSLTSAGNTTS